MNLERKLNEDLKSSMKNKDKVKVETIRLIKKSIKDVQVINKTIESLTDNEIIFVIQKLHKQTVDSIELFEKGGRIDLTHEAKLELTILESYLPVKATEEQIRLVVQNIIENETGEVTKKDIGKIINKSKDFLTNENNLLVDGKELATIVKKLLN